MNILTAILSKVLVDYIYEYIYSVLKLLHMKNYFQRALCLFSLNGYYYFTDMD
jgi:hypothetical protein